MNKVRLVLNQNQVGKYNLGGDDISLAFSLRFIDEKGDTLRVTSEGRMPAADYDGKLELAVFKMPSHPDDDSEGWGQTYKDLFEELDFESLLAYHIKDNGWTTGFSYEAQRVMFVTLIDQYFEDIITGINVAGEERRAREIESLEKRLEVLKSIESAPLPDKPDLKGVLLQKCEEEIEQYKRWRDDYAKGGDSWVRWDNKLKEARAYRKELVNGL